MLQFSEVIETGAGPFMFPIRSRVFICNISFVSLGKNAKFYTSLISFVGLINFVLTKFL